MALTNMFVQNTFLLSSWLISLSYVYLFERKEPSACIEPIENMLTVLTDLGFSALREHYFCSRNFFFYSNQPCQTFKVTKVLEMSNQ